MHIITTSTSQLVFTLHYRTVPDVTVPSDNDSRIWFSPNLLSLQSRLTSHRFSETQVWELD